MPLNIDPKSYPDATGTEAEILDALRQLYAQPTPRARERAGELVGRLTGIWHAQRPTVPAPETRHEIRIIPVETGVQVAYGSNISRAFPGFRNFEIRNGLPLYIADLPEGECNFWSQETVVYGTDEFAGPEIVARIHGIINGRPVFSGYTRDDGTYWTMVDGTGNEETQHAEIDSVHLVCDKTVYVARDEVAPDTFAWSVYIDGKPHGGQFDRKPTIKRLEAAQLIVSSLFETCAANRLSVTGRWKGCWRSEVIDFCPDIAKRLAEIT